MIVRWPGKVPAGAEESQITSLTDVMATVAEMVKFDLPNDSAADSFSMLSTMMGTHDGSAIRPFILQQGFKGERSLVIRRGNWKYLAHQGSGGNNYDKHKQLIEYRLPELVPDAPGQLYNLETDPGETKNLSLEHPDIVDELQAMLNDTLESGRSAPLPAAMQN